ASLLCTDHPSAIHPGYQPGAPCPVFDPVAANKLLDDSGWAKGLDGVRAKAGQRLEFEYSTTATYLPWRLDDELFIQRNFQEIGIKLALHNSTPSTFFGSILSQGKASPPTGARAGRFDIAEYPWGFGYDPDDSELLGCDQFPPKGLNYTFYCNP